MSAARALFVHVPKTGGTSIYRTLVEQLSEGALHNPRNPGYCGPDWFDKRPKVRLFFGHFFYRPELRAHFGWIGTVLRHPVERVRSLYDHARTSSGLPFSNVAKAMTFDLFVHHDSVWIENWACRQLAGGEPDLDRAHAALRDFDFVGGHPLPRSILAAQQSVAKALGLSPSNALRHERRRPPKQRTKVSAQARRVIEKRNVLDLELWRLWRECKGASR